MIESLIRPRGKLSVWGVTSAAFREPADLNLNPYAENSDSIHIKCSLMGEGGRKTRTITAVAFSR